MTASVTALSFLSTSVSPHPANRPNWLGILPWHRRCISRPSALVFSATGRREGEMLARIAGAVRFKEPLSFHTSLRMGGPVDFFIVPRDVETALVTSRWLQILISVESA